MNIDEYISSLTSEERELHKDLIEECKKREQDIRESYLKAQIAIIKLNSELNNLNDHMDGIGKLADAVLDKASDLSLAMKNYLFNKWCDK